ncbi:structural maintenance of chromosomes protein 6 [Plutella xylostella]|uniref:structural maintenance of chromosomes protein 6 n=1 Tax=Plutella xylostella TaxID=51655 RepID=UPI002032B8E4|nr:structural maintenance of chromosomes protein 6 [Plutella xylostella]
MDTESIEDDIDGSIISIHVRNFFCHDNLEINFNKNVNFIIGRNGSGKSAILTALVVGLGARASATNRGSNLNSFIKKGANSASVEIKIKNNSVKAYKHHLYGDYITIIRNINASGGSSYKVKSASGEVISTKFEEVHSIVLAHDIQVDNPISVLNQDDARSFHASDSKKKYSLFRKATNLDQTETNYLRAIDNCQKASNIWARKNEASKELEREFKKWEGIYDQLQSHDEIEAQKQALQNEYYWSEIAEFERDCSSIQVQYDKAKAKIERLMEKLSSMEQNFGSNSETIDALKAELEEKKLQQTVLEQELQQLEGEVRELQAAQRAAQQAANKQNELRNRENKKVNDLEQEIRNIDSGSVASRRAELEARAKSTAAAAAAVEARYNTAQHEVSQSQQHSARLGQHSEQAANNAQRKRDSLKQLKQQLRELESRGNDSLAVFGANMAELVKRVNAASARGQFSAPPKGPVGAYLKVKEKRWSGALEHIIGGNIMNFCVNSPEDSRKLFEIMGQVYGRSHKPGVTCSKFLNAQHDVRRNKVRARGFTCALDALDIADPDIANFLIDNVGFERILLVPEHDDATRLSDNVENVPENCSKIVTLDSTEYHPAPNYRCYGGAGRTGRFLSLSSAERKMQVQAEIQEAQQALCALEAEAESQAQEAKEAREAARQASQTLQALLSERHSKQAAARAAAAALDQMHAPHHAILMEELEVSKKKLDTLNQQIEETNERATEHRRKVDGYDAKMKVIKSQLYQLKTSSRSMEEEIGQEQLKLDQGITQRQMAAQKLKEDKVKFEQVEKILEDKKAVIAQKTRQALASCPRVENPREKSFVCNELKKTHMKLNSIRSDGLTKAQAAEKLQEVGRKYKKTKSTLERLKTLIADIQKTSDKHLKFCTQIQTHIARRVQFCFQNTLTLRGYSGRMDIDNAKGVLEMYCSGREARGARAASTTSSLSGGERSYSTVAFIMALWECVELPFYFMDEFDVFMDNVNRKYVMELLIDHALKNTSRQFVFLTPQDASAVTAGPQIKIHRMADPRR